MKSFYDVPPGYKFPTAGILKEGDHEIEGVLIYCVLIRVSIFIRERSDPQLK